MRSVFVVLLCALGAAGVPAKEKPPAAYTIPLPPKPDFAALDWLVGAWAGKTTGRDSRGEIRLSVAYDLDKRFMVIREEVSLPATKTAPAVSESWLGILSGERASAGFILRTFSTTGFIARYGVAVAGARVDFHSEGGEETPPGWLFRRVWQRLGDTEFNETVQVAPPNKPFFDYYTAKLTRQPPQ